MNEKKLVGYIVELSSTTMLKEPLGQGRIYMSESQPRAR